MYQKEMDIYLSVIKRLAPKRCLEWGSGFSTLYFPNFVAQDSTWLSLEHHSEWAERVKQLNENDQVEVVTIPPSQPHHDGDGTYEQFKDYVEYPSGRAFDLIMVDGRARTECVKKGVGLLSDSGVILLHDANRKKYHTALGSLEHTALFTDHRKHYAGIWLGSHSPLERVLDVNFHHRVWDVHRQIARYVLLKWAVGIHCLTNIN